MDLRNIFISAYFISKDDLYITVTQAEFKEQASSHSEASAAGNKRSSTMRAPGLRLQLRLHPLSLGPPSTKMQEE